MNVENITELLSKRASQSEANRFEPEDVIAKNSGLNDESSSTSDRNIFESLTEVEAGITEYLNKCDGFSAVLKERFSDFQVHEIDLDGNTIKLTNFDIPVVREPTLEVSEDIIDEEIWKQLQNLKEKKVNSVEIDVTSYDKNGRRKIHKLIKAKFRRLFNTNTVIGNGEGEKNLIVVSLNKDNRDMWPYECGDYLHFVLFKINIDTMNAINLIASKLSTKASNFTYAGTKDKRGKTSQQVSMWHLKPERLNSINNCLRNIRVGNFSYKKKQLKLGDLIGNHFKIALRNVEADNETIHTALNSLKKNGFINYFGLQRFGNSPDVPTFKIGKSLVKGDFKTAVELILKPREGKGCKDDLKKAKMIWWKTRDAKKACDHLMAKNTYEAKLLTGLAKHGSNAYVNALDSIPRNVRLLYLHSYQSLLWNKIVSRRIKEFGTSVLEGDLIAVNDGSVNPDIEHCCNSLVDNEKVAVRCVTAEEVNTINISDIVHPLPGYNIIYPNNIIKTWYEELLKDEGLTTDEFRQRVREYSLSGAYRKVVKKVKDLSWEIVFHNKPDDDLILSDLDLINGDVSSFGLKESGEFKAVIIDFTLDSSTYATMAIREVLKIDVSSSYQASLNSSSSKRKPASNGDEVDKKKIKT